ncbi:hypothetical protein DICPUDRAFT_157191 [Dictyostelium purpureum]|uniref:WAPL domain-containing protein n=1 Tax=Dictyostelium purpureum TaxID=5786 RepID=F0ZYH9_DICPU|nr:uncharacterized protein DICPUDRAFT_157191 [Dictyostelium purpureum]EGC31007.1 hypothetical protein DICPUDRAFT_157191 [Dictyostelium purpureum]|eukprot:XP_003292477.1 hypothetical protein DICPUDRAFT_157191 [Dictyostelium purpureum]
MSLFSNSSSNNNNNNNSDSSEEDNKNSFWNKKKSFSKSPTKNTVQPWVLITSKPRSNTPIKNTPTFSSYTKEEDKSPIITDTTEKSVKSSFDFFRKASIASSSAITTLKSSLSSSSSTSTPKPTPTTTSTTTSIQTKNTTNSPNSTPISFLTKKTSDLSKNTNNIKLDTSLSSSTSTISTLSTSSSSLSTSVSSLSHTSSLSSTNSTVVSPFKRNKTEIEPVKEVIKLDSINKSKTSVDLGSKKDVYDIDMLSNFDFDEGPIDTSKPKPPPKKTSKELAHLKKEEKEKEKEKEKLKKVVKTSTSNRKKKSTLSIDLDAPSPSPSSSQVSQDKHSSRSKLKRSKEDIFNDSQNDENTLISSRVLSQSFESNELHYEEATKIIKSLASNDSKIILATLGQLSKIVTEQCSEFTLILRSHSLFTPLCDTLMSLCLFKQDDNNDSNPLANKKSNTPPNFNNKKNKPSPLTTVKRSSSLDSLKKHNTNANIDLLSLFLSTTADDGSASSEILTTTNVNKNNRDFDTSTDTEDEGEKPTITKKKHKSNSGLMSLSSSSTSNKNEATTSNISENNLTDREIKAVYLASCFILFAFSSEQTNIEHFSRGTIEFLYSQAIKIPENYLLEFYTTPSRLPKSPKSPKSPSSSGVSPLKKMLELETSIFSHFQTLVSDTVRFSVSTPSLSLATLSNLASNHINHSMKLRLKEFGLMDGMVKLLTRYIDYLNPILDLSSISPKLIGNIEYILKIIDQCLVGDIKANRVLLVTQDTLSMFLTYIRYLYVAINANNDRLAGLDIKLIGSEAIISILNILLNLTHDNFEASKLINQITKSFNNYDSNNNNNNNNSNSQIINSTNKNKSPINNKNEFGVNKEFSEYLESISNSKFTPRKVKFLESIEIKENFAFKVIIQLLKLEVPEKYDIGQLCISLLVNLVEINPENREILHNMEGAIESILQLYLWRTNDSRIITRVTTKTQEKIASSYLVILIGYLIKDHAENRQLVIKTLPNHSFDDMVKLLMDFIEFQFNSEILTDEFYKLVCNLINDVFLIESTSPLPFSNEIKLKYQSFNSDYDKKLNLTNNNNSNNNNSNNKQINK